MVEENYSFPGWKAKRKMKVPGFHYPLRGHTPNDLKPPIWAPHPVLGMEPRASGMLGKFCTTEIHTPSL
jgi:hypothetical protein